MVPILSSPRSSPQSFTPPLSWALYDTLSRYRLHSPHPLSPVESSRLLLRRLRALLLTPHAVSTPTTTRPSAAHADGTTHAGPFKAGTHCPLARVAPHISRLTRYGPSHWLRCYRLTIAQRIPSVLDQSSFTVWGICYVAAVVVSPADIKGVDFGKIVTLQAPPLSPAPPLEPALPCHCRC